MITSAENRPWPGDVPIGNAYADIGLPAASVIRPVKIATVEASATSRLGRITPALMAQVSQRLREILGF